MDRTIIVLTPSEWENRASLLEFAKQSHNHNHYNKDAQLAIKSLVSLAKRGLSDGNVDEAIKHLDSIPDICERIYQDSCRAQDGVSGLMTLIESFIETGERK
jgi:3-deoxy-D-arabino-heptulosonate 7-phosphate (DAHP) synthase